MNNRQKIKILKRELWQCLDVLEGVGCQFFACDGPDKPFITMATCYVCAQIQDIRRVLKSVD